MAERIGAARRSAPEGKGVATRRRTSRRNNGLGAGEAIARGTAGGRKRRGRSGVRAGAGGGGSSGPCGAAPLPSPSSSSSSSLAHAPATAGKENSSPPPARSRTKWTAAGRPERERRRRRRRKGAAILLLVTVRFPAGVMRRVMKRRRKSRGRRRGRWGCRRAAPDESLSGSAKAMTAAASTFDMMDDKAASAADSRASSLRRKMTTMRLASSALRRKMTTMRLASSAWLRRPAGFGCRHSARVSAHRCPTPSHQLRVAMVTQQRRPRSKRHGGQNQRHVG
uniref:Uncharacterized protein n=1 Tax=Oryza sativa subsp. japonica TaxID=39947 RepID=Q6YTK6_ORYSJ|nr:hypothetical protein [Oryza sativa Japonica Group]